MNLIQTYLSTCLHCGSFRVTPAGLCVHCQALLSDYGYQSDRIQERLRALYLWYPGESDLLSALVLSLKGKRSQRAWDVFARRMVVSTLPNLKPGKRLHFVPAPSKDGKEDHAFYFAQALAKHAGGIFLPCLGKASSGNQRSADRGQRALIEMELVEKNTALSENSTDILWVFVDDILTTGSTARAAQLALGSPPHFEIWVLAVRGLSCGQSSDMLQIPNA